MGKSSREKNKTSKEIAFRESSAESLYSLPEAEASQKPLAQRTQNFKYYLAATVSLITFFVYLSALQNEFVNFDDPAYVFENAHIRSFDTAFLKWAFSDFYVSYLHPLTWMSHALDYAVWGLNPLGHHLTNIILHAVNTFLVVFVIVRLVEVLKERTTETRVSAFLNNRTILIIAGVTGLLFGLHPLHVESVAWVSERKDLLCALLYLLSIMAYVRYANDASDVAHRAERIGSTPGTMHLAFFTNRHYLFALVLFVLALMSKPMAVTLPVILLILDWYPFNRLSSFRALRSAVVEKLPFFALSLFASMLAVLAQKKIGAMILTEAVPLSTRILVAAKSLIAYLWKMIWPLDLSPFYPYPQNRAPFSVEYLAPMVLVIGITITCLVFVKNQKLWLAIWGYYGITLLPVLGIVQVGIQSMADRYTYLPSLGPFCMMGLLAAWVSRRANTIKKGGHFVRVVSAAVAISTVVSLAYLTREQISIWRNSIDLWSFVIEKEPVRVPMAYKNRGESYYEMGKLNKALEDYERGIILDPLYADAYYGRGLVFAKLHQFEKAIAAFDKAIALNHNGVTTDVGLDFYLLNRGRAYLEIGQLDHALPDLKSACELGSDSGCMYLQYYQTVVN